MNFTAFSRHLYNIFCFFAGGYSQPQFFARIRVQVDPRCHSVAIQKPRIIILCFLAVTLERYKNLKWFGSDRLIEKFE
jgi:hypothetical protein